ncbi:hypothetical protein FHW36_106450 [Chitinophaga polysaccharea]|uniref:Uncharacterized protein n=1 Tax=Chitinophaga polysaccharea TaxID=1293035 RepID=A0A561PMA8_9BACT|nr:hypothetical protein FHW36_106450 [Chitinophaga polysaccharea]
MEQIATLVYNGKKPGNNNIAGHFIWPFLLFVRSFRLLPANPAIRDSASFYQ